ncbi:non-ribosomal peptide synthetase [Dyella subtropica]|uniref:non-ribosomal peptide synthetase n=1 Tax=Dyella subtropica TaxID=2992127 RepID=UPI00224EB021|nr:non-ribosomal peptide synthetase [Dyella subtropica]
MSTAQFLGILKNLNIKLWLEDGALRVRALPDVLTAELKTELSERKPEIIRLLQQLSHGSGEKPVESRTGDEESIPLSFSQKRLWFLDQLQPGVPAYNTFSAAEVGRRIDPAVLERTVDELVRRHEILRTSFPAVDGVPVQHIAPTAQVLLPLVDLSSLTAEERAAEVRRRILEESKTPFDLARGSMLRIRLIKLAEERYVWLQSIHHIISDDWSMKLLDRELNALYAAFSAGLPSPLPELPIQWADFALWQHQWLKGKVLDAHIDYWAGHLGGELPVLHLARNRSRQVETRGCCGNFFFPPALSAALRRWCETERVTLFMTLIAGYSALLSRYTLQDDIIIGSAVSDRGRVETESLIGFFLNTLPLRVRVDKNASFRDLLQQIRRTCLAAFDHSAVPYEELMPKLQITRDTSGSPLFQTMLVLLNSPTEQRSPDAPLQAVEDEQAPDIEHFEGAFGAYVPSTGNGTTKFDLSVTLEETPAGLTGRTEFNGDLFDQQEIGKLIERLQIFLGGALAEPDRPVAELDLLTEAEREALLMDWAQGAKQATDIAQLHQFLERQAALRPTAVAVEEDGVALSYAELNAQANQLARVLRARGVRPESRVGILFERSSGMLVALMAVLKAGGACVPLDPATPVQRLDFIVEDAGIDMLLTMSDIDLGLAAAARIVFHLDREQDSMAQESGADLAPTGHAGSLACVLYTSGSTGQPKGVMLSHGALVNYAVGAGEDYGIEPSDRVLQFASIAFDASFEEIFSTFAKGATLVLRPAGMLESSEHFMDRCGRMGITVLMLPTAYWHEIVVDLDHVPLPPMLRCVVIGGERASPMALAQWQAKAADRIDLFNTYGPTETAIAVTRYKCPARTDQDGALREVSLGRPVANVAVHILDQAMRPVPAYMQGEIFVGGAAVAQGYLNQPELTAERFVDDPFGPPGSRLYRTGDLGRYNAAGEIEYLGRNDFQVKIRGFRIELGEIEAKLAACEGVAASVVIAREDRPGDKRLVAYIRAEAGIVLSVSELRAALSRQLPEYMVPSAFVTLKDFPLTVNGKLDSKALPAPEADAFVTQAYEAPVGRVETAIADIWQELLGVERVGRHDNFFELGGHSLLAVRLLARMRQMDLHADVQTLFSTPTVSGLAAAIGGGADVLVVPDNLIPPDATAITPAMLSLVELTAPEIERIAATVPGGAANIQDIYPLAPLQEGMLFHHMLATEGDPYQVRALSVFESRTQLDSYLAALRFAIDRHDMLRTGIVWEGLSEPAQVVWRKAELAVEELALSASDGDVADQLWARFDPREYRLDLHQAPLFRLFVAYDERSDRWIALQLLHHLCMDHMAQDQLQAEIALYLQGRQAELPRALPFRNFVAQARLGVSASEHEAFFREMLGDVGEPTIPFGLADVRGDGSDIDEIRRAIDAGLARRLRSRARALGVSAASLFYLAWAQVLARVSGRDDVVFGTVLFGRMQGENALGLGINTLPVRIRIDESSVDTSVRAVHRLISRLLRHEHASLALAQNCSGVQAPAPLFSALLNYRHSAASEGQGAAVQWEGVVGQRSEERTNYPLTLAIDDLGEGFELVAQVPASVGPARVCAMVHRALEQLVDALERAPSSAVCELDVLGVEERHQLLEAFNDTAVDYPQVRCLHQLFEAQAERTPDAIALVFRDHQLTYDELNVRANQVAHRLVSLGVKPDDRVALYTERSAEMVVGLLGVLKAGGSYVPLDPDYPVDRIGYMLADSAPKLVLTQEAWRRRLQDVAPPVVMLDDAESLALQPRHDPVVDELSSTHLAYVIYTSGSTGNPKGVMVEHGAIVNRLQWMQDAYRLDGSDRILQKTPFSFDVSVWEFFWPLSYGARIVLAEPGGHKDPAYLRDLIVREAVTATHFVPSMLRQFLSVEDLAACTRLRYVFCSGEALPADVVGAFLASSTAHLHNLYGPTEASVDVTFHACRAQDVGLAIPIGRPIANTQIYILDDRRRPVPVGVAGEIHIGGVGVARGYLNRPTLTAERFVDDPFGSPGGRLYRTGDLGRYNAAGEIEYLGRNDFQVKIRGFRIELGEIEAKLAACAGVAASVVIAREDQPGDKRLVAYLRAEAGSVLAVADLRAELSKQLPDYMVPNAFVTLEDFPLTVNGKLDRKALPAPEADAFATQAYEAPIGRVETAIAEIWQDLLGVERVGRHDNFFELGGHSLLAVRLLARMRQVDLHAHVRMLFETPTLSGLAAATTGDAEVVAVPDNLPPPDATAITPAMLSLIELTAPEIERIAATVPGGAANIQDIYPLVPLQEGILFHHMLATDGDPYVLRSLSTFGNKAQLESYLTALRFAIGRHDMLRTGVVWEGLSEPVQVVWRKAELVVEEPVLSASDGDIAEQLWTRFDPRRCRLDLRQAPLFKLFAAYDERNDRWVVLQLLHQLCMDHMAQEHLQAEVAAYLQGRQAELPPALPFRNFVAQARLGVSASEHEAFFRQMLGDVDEPTIPFGLANVHGDGSNIVDFRREVDAGLARRLRSRARALGVSAASLCHLATALVFARASGQNDVVFGTVLFGGMQGENALGLGINTLPVRIRIDESSVDASVRAVHGLISQLLHHEHASLVLAQNCSGVRAPAPLFSALLNYRHTAASEESKPSGAQEEAGHLRSEERTNYPLTLAIDDFGEGFELLVQVQESIGPARVCAMLHRAMEQLVDALEYAPSTPVCQLDVLDAAERQQVVETFNDTTVDYPKIRCLHQLFEAQVGRTPDAIALVFKERQLTYAELNARANQLAHHLLGQGIKPDDRVALYAERSAEMVVGLLGVLKAGASYVPLDPDYPVDRIGYMLADSAPKLVLTQEAWRRRLQDIAPPVVLLDDAESLALQPRHDPVVDELSSTQLAYVIYTSGSTGNPKGVMVEHGAIVNRLQWMQDAYRLDGMDRVLQKTPFSFDVSVWEFFWPLSYGARIVLAEPGGHKDPADLRDLIVGEAVTVTHFVPSMLRQFLSVEDLAACTSLRHVFCSGEALPADVARDFLASSTAHLHNLYGPTEASVDVTFHACRTQDVGLAIPIGRPIANTQIYILDERRRPVPVGVAGEIHIGGVGVARGYLNRPTLTAERFVDDPFGSPGSRLYRTGDLGRYNAAGEIEYLGRNDFQVKIRGFRIELGEIEAKLAACAGVAASVVIAREDQPGDKRLVAYLRAEAGSVLAVADLRAELSKQLPDYMVPNAFVTLEDFPLTVNGKLDRKALPAPEVDAYATQAYEAPIGRVETAIAEIWQELLGVERVGRHDNFFELGGHSLLAVRLLARMRQVDLHASVQALFAAAVLEQFAERVSMVPRLNPAAPKQPVYEEGFI